MHTLGTLSLRVGLDALRANPLRTVLSTLGVIMGVGSMVAVLAIGDGVEALGREQVASTTDLLIVSVTPQTARVLDGVAVGRTDVVTFAPSDLDGLRAAVPEMASAMLVRRGGGAAQRDSGAAPRGVRVTATTASAFAAGALVARAGALFTEADVAAARPVAVLSASAADTLAGGAGGATLVGKTVLLQGRPFTVSGVLAPVAHDRMEVFLPITAAGLVASGASFPGSSGDPGAVGGLSPTVIVLAARAIEGVTPMRRGIERWLAGRYGPAWRERVRVMSNAVRLEQLAKALLVYKLLMGSITGISLLVGGVGIMNVLLASVTERTREIGIRKATGARNKDILAQFLAESVAITGAGAALGVALGLAVAFGAARVMRWVADAQVHAAISPATILVAAIASVGVGLSFGLYPALRAARLSPIEAIRHE